MTRPKVWSEEVEEAYRFQLAGYRDEKEYLSVKMTQAGPTALLYLRRIVILIVITTE